MERTRVGSGWGPSASRTARAAAVEGAQTSENRRGKPDVWLYGKLKLFEVAFKPRSNSVYTCHAGEPLSDAIDDKDVSRHC